LMCSQNRSETMKLFFEKGGEMWQHIINVSLLALMAALVAIFLVKSLNELKDSFMRILLAVGTFFTSVAIYFFINIGAQRVGGVWRDLFMFFLGAFLITTFVLLWWSIFAPAPGSPKRQVEKNTKSIKHRCLLSRRFLLKQKKRHLSLLR